MIKTIIGVILLLIPFLLLYKFKDKKIGFAYILSFLLAFHLAVAIITQLFGVFNYPVIIVINFLAALIVIARTNFKELFSSLRKIKIDWVLVFVIIIILIQLFSVHYKYTGKVTSVVENYKEVRNMKYPYPYFSDEWSGVALVKYSIVSGKLPLANPLWYDSYFSNFELPFHSFVSEIMLLLNLNPLIHYTVLTIFSGLIICLLVYFILRVNKISKLPASIACLFVPYIINGANLPGIWTLIPLTLGLISMLLGFLFISDGRKQMILFLAFLTLIFYPPLFVFYTPALVLYFISAKEDRKERVRLIYLYFIICIIVALLMAIRIYLTNNYSLDNTLAQVMSRIYYTTLTQDAIPDFTIYKVVPIPILLLGFFGIFKTLKKEKVWLPILIFVGLFFWFLYSRVLWVFIIGHERNVVSTSILITIMAGFGLHYLIELIRENNVIRKYKILKIIQILILTFFLIFAFSYTQRDDWKELKLYSYSGKVFSPASPANIYLHEDDLRLFQNIKEKRFLSLPWKGLVIGTATGNYPLETKPATLTNQITSFNEFMNADCKEKRGIARENEIDYVYSKEFDCDGFEEMGVSEEGLHLYAVKLLETSLIKTTI